MGTWPEYRLKHLTRLVVDKATGLETEGPYVGLESIASWTGEINTENNEENGESLGNRFRCGDVLFGKLRPYLAKVTAPNFFGHCSGEALVLRPSSQVSSRFLRYRLVEEGTIDAVNASTYGAKMPRASWDFIGNIRFPFPDLETQKAIADFLDQETARIDQLIEKKQQLVGLLNEKARRAVTLTFEQLASEYKNWRLKHVLISGLAYGANEPADSDDPNDVRYIRITDIDADGNLRDDTFKSLPRERVGEYILEDGDILLARSGATVGKSFIYRDVMGECCYAGYLIRARFNKKRILPEFFNQFTSTDQYWNHILGTNIQATIQNVSAEKYANLAFPLPPIHQQDAITAEIMQRNEKNSAAKRTVSASIDRLREFRSALITAAVTGQINVTTWGKEGQTDRRLDQIEEAMRA